jgi:hypothetical protein
MRRDREQNLHFKPLACRRGIGERSEKVMCEFALTPMGGASTFQADHFPDVNVGDKEHHP